MPTSHERRTHTAPIPQVGDSHRRRLGVTVAGTTCVTLAAAAVLASPATAADAPPRGEGGTDKAPAACVSRTGTAQRPPGPRSDESLTGYDVLPVAAQQEKFPRRIDLRDSTSGFNRRFEFTLREGLIYTRAIGGDGRWRHAALPACLQGALVGMSVNDDELVAVDAAGWLYTMDNALSSPGKWNWMKAWGAPFWAGSGQRTPTTDPGRWVLSILGTHEDVSFTDRIGNPHAVAFAKVTQVLALSEDGSRITYLDPWLPNDYSYEVGGPMGGRFKSQAISASGSTIFVTNKYGDMYTRLYDFDVSGGDTAFFRYSWQDQRGKPSIVDQTKEKLNLKYAAIQLPAPDWVHQPKIPGKITSRISIHSTGAGSHNRELRVEGSDGGRKGYWKKALTAPKWTFVQTDQPLRGRPLQNTPQDNSTKTLSAPQQYSYRGELTPSGSKNTYVAALPHFDVAQTSRTFSITSGGTTVPVTLHSYDALRIAARGPGIDGKPRTLGAALEVPTDVITNLPTQPLVVQDFVKRVMKGNKIREVSVTVTDAKITIPTIGMTLARH
ncbi:hypothetical protein KEM60_00610 [Austwickia sp. TVS 96-490-7B]|uniref:hypothetical protein n=1 Tax=Austwickia sp. TVS 96-490-7B TaxID=2830843 RepID=UPI001C55D6FC|nr:hypothetical protein [Austwickia sp. TVS 96-490-7B]MBW3084423.1 hypothetical protein [Austwickia sp. TVS 96-490-7B]